MINLEFGTLIRNYLNNYIRIFEYVIMMTDELSKEERIHRLHADLCKMLSNCTRLKILEGLRDGEKTVGTLVEEVGVRQANLSQHLAELRKRDIVRSRREGANVYYRIAYPKVVEACELIREVVFEQLSESKDLVEE